MPANDPPAPPAKGRVRAVKAQPLGVVAIDGGMLTLETVSQLTGLGKSTVRKMVERGDFPAAVHVTPRAIRWRAEEIRIWLERKRRD